ncbi:3-oxosteroid 1-dehydrogenase [Sinobacterium caligoides]|uniref:3-oxosteroid 1-dehydrogenase n=2 Tax=Sinobacterium caligoides TaxID=933926 RepID=A0A3N2DYU3_9GAMM|nr:3-oxosteroid 1-dehydrogenase [Sinobacterium caligoides]
MTKRQWQHTVDTLIVGSGNGAMTTALCSHILGTADILLIEKDEKIGGTSALSGGGIWIPNNRYAKAAGAKDSIEDAKAYLTETIPDTIRRDDMIDCYLENAPKMVDMLHENTRIRYDSLEKYPDYYSNATGARNGHRSLEPTPFKVTELEDELDNILPGTIYMFDRINMSQHDAQIMSCKEKGAKRLALKKLFKHYSDIPWLLKHHRGREVSCGFGGIAQLYIALRERNIPLWRNTAMIELISEDGIVIGAVVEKEGKRMNIRARKAVVLACGGFEHNQQMREKYLPSPTNTQWSAGTLSNTGDGINAGLALGAQTSLMDNAWWCTTMHIPRVPYPFLSIVTKAQPGTIVVNKKGKRFSNESQNYMAFQKELLSLHSEENPCAPCYMIFDDNFKKKYGAYPLMGPKWTIPKDYFEEGLVACGDTVEELATNAGLDVENLKQTVNTFNGYARTGKDLDFKRGDYAYDRYYGDPTNKPNPCLGEILTPPLYSLTLQAGDFGTQGGLTTNCNAQVLDTEGQAITGLYATGNCSAAVLPTYPGPGSTLGPAMTFAYQAAKHIQGQQQQCSNSDQKAEPLATN